MYVACYHRYVIEERLSKEFKRNAKLLFSYLSFGETYALFLIVYSFSRSFIYLYFRDALITSSINCFTSFFAGFAVFAVLGHMATIQGKEVRDVARSGKSIQGRCKITIGVVGMKLFQNTFSRVVIFEDILSRYRFSNYRQIQNLQYDSSLIFQQFGHPDIKWLLIM